LGVGGWEIPSVFSLLTQIDPIVTSNLRYQTA
jgi:hypothetical protein